MTTAEPNPALILRIYSPLHRHRTCSKHPALRLLTVAPVYLGMGGANKTFPQQEDPRLHDRSDGNCGAKNRSIVTPATAGLDPARQSGFHIRSGL